MKIVKYFTILLLTLTIAVIGIELIQNSYQILGGFLIGALSAIPAVILLVKGHLDD